MKKIAVLTSGGDAPGMNAAIRAVVRTGIDRGWEVCGVEHGYRGLVGGDFIPLDRRDVGGIIQLGGTVLGSARCPEFMTEDGQRRALRELNRHEIKGLVVIGGNGSQTGAHALFQLGFPVVGVASTIDNDLVGSDITIGVDTALNTILDAIDKIKDTASSHNRAFIIETMGRNCGYLALMGALAGGAELALIPEHNDVSLEAVSGLLKDVYVRGKNHCIIVVAEGWKPGTPALSAYLNAQKEQQGFEVRATVLGHVQRGGSPTAYDRILATRLGAAAAEALHAGRSGVMIGWIDGKIAETPIGEVIQPTNKIKPDLLRLARVMER